MRRTIFISAAVVFAGLAFVLAGNVGGWRARILSRITRVDNDPVIVSPALDFRPQVPPGFSVSVFAKDFENPRWLAVSPNGDVFVSDSGAGEVVVLHRPTANTTAQSRAVFADHRSQPFGIAFDNHHVYVADTDQVVRFPYDPSSSARLGGAEHLFDLPGGGYNQHWTRSLAFSLDRKRLYVSVGSRKNIDVEPEPRATIMASDPDGKNARTYASGLRNAVGIACDPESGLLWATVNERDDIGDDVPNDFFTHIHENGFYGWPYAYGDRRVDNRVSPRPDLVAKMIKPDVYLDAHVAPLQFAFYDKEQFPPEYRHGVFVAEHGSWNRRIRSGYQVEFIPFRNGAPSGRPQLFLWGFVPDPAKKEVYGRPVGVAVTPDGALLVSDDGANVIWRISYEGTEKQH